MELDQPVQELKGVGPKQAEKLQKLGIRTVNDLLEHFPRRYDDYSQITKVAALRPGQVTVRVKVKQVVGRYLRRGLHITEAVASDSSGSVRLIWFNQPYRKTSIKPQAEYFVSGKFELGRGRLSINNPSMELVSDFPVNTARIVPIYPETKGLKSNQIRKIIKQHIDLIDGFPEVLPKWLISEFKLMPRNQALRQMHFPTLVEKLEEAKRRLGFEEVFALSLASLITKFQLQTEDTPPIPFHEELARDFVEALPFKLTDDQRRVVWRIYQDLAKQIAMNRLVEGDVGSGKTVVAAMAALMALKQGFQVAFMAPTELLARQHAETVYQMLKPLNYEHHVGLLVGSLKPTQKSAMHKRIASGEVGLLIGTHALIEEKVNLSKLGLVVVDEQHRFGVEQRLKLQAKAGHPVHVLSMSATPIPRSLALTLYGELDISILKEKPAGRLPVITKIVSPNSRKQLYDEIRQQLDAGRQLFVVAPLIEESDLQPQAASVTKLHKEISQDFAGYKVGLMHGRLSAEDKNQTMEKFVKHKLDILVSTTVIEVGVDVPNATMMLIENADKFGLAQAHQLRGRIGRGSHQGYCYLMPSDSKPPNKRLLALASSSDGFALAELDLKLRGPGAIYGRAQHGALDLRIAKLDDTKTVLAARRSADKFIQNKEDLLHYPWLNNQITRLRAITNLN